MRTVLQSAHMKWNGMEWLFAFSVAILWSFCLIENLHREIAHTPRGPGPATVRRQTNKYSSTCARLLAPVILISLQQLMDLLRGRGGEGRTVVVQQHTWIQQSDWGQTGVAAN